MKNVPLGSNSRLLLQLASFNWRVTFSLIFILRFLTDKLKAKEVLKNTWASQKRGYRMILYRWISYLL